jgi:site-specific DNA recombinase
MTPQKRCAIYTRKSTDEGLDMAFNSLDAQREACEAYVRSQRSEGWLLLPTAYDDGGFSGGSMERPGLKRLMADVQAGKVDVIVVYKVDRLTRALSDFAKIVDVFDAAGASFVSVTQAFNTTTSMGRLTLNVLLSFAQFEREVGAERIRDKIAQSKAKGMWMGGPVPLGYAVQERRLVPVPSEIETVRHIFELYLKLPSVRALKERLDNEGIVTKVQNGKHGPTGGQPFARGALYNLLANPVYIGKIRHKDKVHDGLHPAIIDQPLWDAVQSRLAQRAPDKQLHRIDGSAAPLLGMIRDHVGRPMSPTHTQSKGKRYHYYCSSTTRDINAGEGDVEPVVRISAKYVHDAIRYAVKGLLDPQAVCDLLEHNEVEPSRIPIALASAAEWASVISATARLRELLIACRFELAVAPDRVSGTLENNALLSLLLREPDQPEMDSNRMLLDIPIELRKRGKDMKLVLRPEARPSMEPEPRLVRLLVKAEQARRQVFESGATKPDRHVCRMARLAFLAPDITQAILEGRQPSTLSSRTLLKMGQLPLDWAEQRRILGFRKQATAHYGA